MSDITTTNDDAALALFAGLGQTTDEVTDQPDRMPQLKVLQALSPELKKKSEKYIADAEYGSIVNTVTREAFDGDIGVGFLPVHYDHYHQAWSGSKDAGDSKPEARYETTDPVIRKLVKDNNGYTYGDHMVDPNGHKLTDTHNVFGVLLNDDGTAQLNDKGNPTAVFLALTGTNVQPMSDWFQALKTRQPGVPRCLFPSRIVSYDWVPRKTPNAESNSKALRYEPLNGGTWADLKQSEMLTGAEPIFDTVRELVLSFQQSKEAAVSEDVPF